MSTAAGTTLHVATDWPAFGLFFLGLVGSLGGFTSWILRRLDKNRNEWKAFVSHEVSTATAELKAEVAALAGAVSGNTREIVDQGKAIARIEGRLGTTVSGVAPT